MRRALALARRAEGWTSPNPMVGAVLVKDGQVVGEGYHRRAGAPHAEVEAIRAAGPNAAGATLYVTLEPCNHHGRTPPCTEAILAAGIREVHVAVPDPNPEVAGGGGRWLADHGIRVVWGEEAAAALALNRPFFCWARLGRPYVILKAATSLDGKVATSSGQSKYLTQRRALAAAHAWRRKVDAIAVGSGTVLADDPALTYRGRTPGRDPVRVVLDGRGRIPPTAALFSTSSAAPALVYTTDQASREWERAVFVAGGEVVRVQADAAGHPRLDEVLSDLAHRHVLSLLVEGGPTVHAALIRAGFADRWLSFLAPLVLGDPAPGAVGPPGWTDIRGAPRLEVRRVQRLDPDILIEADFRDSPVVGWEREAEELASHASSQSAPRVPSPSSSGPADK
ncbi:MAG: bifunctional diaminohydroxyphosphoribosylaminopyrimidine deaminase/5-amino-6-(5-phosphoribosylamino)uracil reductase RibD [Firmicutes bacterium]|nr:bifunctional diaminohydroxyphosphoribosylaminopyrimidine deaminase/5-amino-6-(5-phosphoribosylamino)uracil reductase RibD [Alicyclobacillaceae bacterium]MCL6497158.1 bifunctional diaminohydroxyphosphoribosylaminopyrimidine deaminase/5-amino-6-(5-phosphoribosylamino)uracil reductase RibD [Bacillota bacterium]